MKILSLWTHSHADGKSGVSKTTKHFWSLKFKLLLVNSSHVFCFVPPDLHSSSLQSIPPDSPQPTLHFHYRSQSSMTIIVQETPGWSRLSTCQVPVQSKKGSTPILDVIPPPPWNHQSLLQTLPLSHCPHTYLAPVSATPDFLIQCHMSPNPQRRNATPSDVLCTLSCQKTSDEEEEWHNDARSLACSTVSSRNARKDRQTNI